MLASLAAFVFMASILVDPFVQLVFTFPSRMAPASTTAPFLLTTDTMDSRLESYQSGQAGQVPTQLQASILQGLYEEPYNRQAFCPTGECAWQNVNTLGVCASCENITSTVTSKELVQSTEGRAQQYTFPGPSYLAKINMYSPNHFLIGKDPSYTGWNSSTIGNQPPDLIDMHAVQRVITGTDADGFPVLSPATCWQCTFSFCSKTHSHVEMKNGTMNMPPPLEEPLHVVENGTAEEPTIGLIRMAKGVASPSSGGAISYTVNEADQSNLAAYLSDLFTAGWYTDNRIWRPQNDGYQYVSPNIARSLGESAELDATVKAIAESMTHSIRTNRNSTEFHGQAFVERTYIKVQWAWLVLPITLTAVTCGVLLAVTLQTQHRGVVAWKSSGLALLFHELQGCDVPAGAFESVSALDRTAGRIEGRLVQVFERPAFGATENLTVDGKG